MSPWRSLVAVRASGSRPPLFAVHDGSGMALFYREFTRLLGPDQPVFGLQARGLDGGEPLQTRIEEMAASYLDEVRRVQPAGPYYLLGDCVGGLIAYEMARQLQSVGEEVGLLAMIEAYPIGRRMPIELRMRGFRPATLGLLQRPERVDHADVADGQRWLLVDARQAQSAQARRPCPPAPRHRARPVGDD